MGRLIPTGIGIALLAAAIGGRAAEGQRFGSLTVGAQTFTNAVVVSLNANDVYIRHASGFVNVKVRDLDPATQEELGFVIEVAPTNTTPQSISETLHLDPQIVEFESHIQERVEAFRSTLTPPVIGGALCALLLAFLFFSYCAKLICVKAGHPPGGLIWVPILQWIPLFKAAEMGGFWFVLFIIPLTSWLAALTWAFKIAKARKKSWFVSLLLIFPVTNVLAFIYLAFSHDDDEESRESSPPAAGDLVLR